MHYACMYPHVRRRGHGTWAPWPARRLSEVHPAAAVYVAAVQRECGAYDDAIGTLSAALNTTPDEPLLMTALAHECLYSDQVCVCVLVR